MECAHIVGSVSLDEVFDNSFVYIYLGLLDPRNLLLQFVNICILYDYLNSSKCLKISSEQENKRKADVRRRYKVKGGRTTKSVI